MIIDLSARSQDLLQEYLSAIDPERITLEPIPDKVDLGTLCSWLLLLMNKESTGNEELIGAELCAELFQVLINSFPEGEVLPRQVEEENRPTNKFKLIMLVLAGILVVACEGFDGVTTILSFFTLPSLLVFIAGIVFSILSVFLFCSFDILQVAKELGVKIFEGPKLLDIYLQQLQAIKTLRRKIEGYRLAELSAQELVDIEKLLFLLQERLDILGDRSRRFETALNSKTTKAVKYLIASMSGLLFFGGGFFAGQSVAVFVLGAFFATIPAFWPVLIFSCAVGLAAFSIYWCLERPGVQKLISGWFGLDEDKVDRLCNDHRREREHSKLNTLQQNVHGILQLKTNHTKTEVIEEQSEEPEVSETKNTLASENRYRFHRMPAGVINDNESLTSGLEMTLV